MSTAWTTQRDLYLVSTPQSPYGQTTAAECSYLEMPLLVKSELFIPSTSIRLLTYGSVPHGNIRAEGKIKNVNTIEDFKNTDKAAMLNTAATQVSAASPSNHLHAD